MATKAGPTGPKRRRRKATRTISDLLLEMAALEERVAVYLAIVDFLSATTGDDFGDNPNHIITDSGSPVTTETVLTVMEEIKTVYSDTEDQLNKLKDTEVELDE